MMHRYKCVQQVSIFIILVTLGFLIGACTAVPSPSPALPTLASLPTLTPSPPQLSTPISSATPVPSATMTDTPVPSATITDTPISPINLSSATPPITATSAPLLPTIISPTITPLPEAFSFGRSAGGRDLLAYRFGIGDHILLLIGGIHTGFEENTVTLLDSLRAHYERVPADIQSGIQLVVIPVLNVDGLQYGRQLRGRFNANNVDLNRNWGCGWSAEAVFGDIVVNPGTTPFSEPETQSLAALIQEIQPSAVIFFHGAANGVFAGRCEGVTVSDPLAQVYSEVSGYPYGDSFGSYRITGSAPSWINSLGIPSIDVELATARGTEFSRNLRAVNAIQTWLRDLDSPER